MTGTRLAQLVHSVQKMGGEKRGGEMGGDRGHVAASFGGRRERTWGAEPVSGDVSGAQQGQRTADHFSCV